MPWQQQKQKKVYTCNRCNQEYTYEKALDANGRWIKDENEKFGYKTFQQLVDGRTEHLCFAPKKTGNEPAPVTVGEGFKQAQQNTYKEKLHLEFMQLFRETFAPVANAFAEKIKQIDVLQDRSISDNEQVTESNTKLFNIEQLLLQLNNKTDAIAEKMGLTNAAEFKNATTFLRDQVNKKPSVPGNVYNKPVMTEADLPKENVDLEITQATKTLETYKDDIPVEDEEVIQDF